MARMNNDIPKLAIKQFKKQRRSAQQRGIPFLFTLEEWWAWWSVDNRWSNRGTGRGQLAMVRADDRGAYEAGNVVCITLAALRAKTRAPALAFKHFDTQQRSAKRRGIPFLFTFEQW